MLTIVVVIILFSLLVILHEWGHFIMARRGGVEVEEFGIGFPPRIGGKKVGKTFYSVNWLPLGGFVRLKGEDASEVGPGTFSEASYGVKARVLLAGVGMNLLTAVVILYGLCVIGLPALGASFEPSFLKHTYAQTPRLTLTEVTSGSPAAQAGLVRGDFLLKANDTVLSDDGVLRTFTKEHAGQNVVLTVQSGEAIRSVVVKLRPASAGSAFLGVAGQQVYKLRYDPLRAVVAAFYITGALFVATIAGVFELIIHLPQLIFGLFATTVPKAAESASGPLGIIYILKSLSSLGYSYIFLFMANIAVALAAFNVLPLPALDGGRLAIISAQRFLKRQISADTEARIHATGFLALIGLMLVVSIYDVRKIFFHG